MYNNAYIQLNQNHYNQIIQNQFSQNINQNYGNNYLNRQQNYKINTLYKINQFNNQFQIQNFKNLNNNYPNYYQNNHYISNNNIQFNNNNNTHQNNINHYKQHNHNHNLTIHHPNQFTIKNNNEKNIDKVECNIKKECDTGYAKSIPEDINDKLYNSIVKIILNNGLKATGFFMKIKINREIKCLFTCKHVIGQNDINNKININLYYDKKDKEN